MILMRGILLKQTADQCEGDAAAGENPDSYPGVAIVGNWARTFRNCFAFWYSS
jgi:hypothetical protein